jgi:hypothetical protein
LSYARYQNAPGIFSGGQVPRPPIRENSFEIIFNNISFYEVDMIPFFQYFPDTIGPGLQGHIFIDNRVKSPYFAVAPFIDYRDQGFDFLSNVNLTIDSDDIIGQNISSIISSDDISGSYVSSDPTTTGGTNDIFISL